MAPKRKVPSLSLPRLSARTKALLESSSDANDPPTSIGGDELEKLMCAIHGTLRDWQA